MLVPGTEPETNMTRETRRAPLGLSDAHRQMLTIDPVWDPMRYDPGFQQLLAGKEQIGPNK
jgi:hypothetical protein